MSITITDPELLKQLEEAGDLTELRRPDVTWLGRVQKERWDGKVPPGFVSPISDEQRAESRRHRRGRPLKDILHDLEEKYGK